MKVREKLARLNGVRCGFQAVFVRFGLKSGYKGGPVTTILLKDIVKVGSGEVVTDHLWFTQGKRFEALDLKKGDVVQFDARVTEYNKGYRGRYEDDYNYKPVERDYRLSFPSRLTKVEEGGKPRSLPLPAQPKISQQNLVAFM